MTGNRWYTRRMARYATKIRSYQRFLTNALFRIGAALCLCSAGHAADLTIFAAASLNEALNENVKTFSAHSGHRVRVSYAASSALAKQIERGAPADLFISADTEWMDYAAQRDLLAPGTRRNLVGNTLVLIAPAPSPSPAPSPAPAAASGASSVQLKIAPHFALVQALQGRRLALANSDVVPAGKYARAALTSLGVWHEVEKSLTRSENVRAALALVARGEAPLGIVYVTDAKAEPRVRVVDTFAATLHPPVLYPAAVVKGRLDPAVQALLDFLGSAPARAVWLRHGFSAPP